MESLKTLDSNFAIYSVLNQNPTESVRTRMGFSAPRGSVLSYQFSVTEANFKVCENIDQLNLPVID